MAGVEVTRNLIQVLKPPGDGLWIAQAGGLYTGFASSGETPEKALENLVFGMIEEDYQFEPLPLNNLLGFDDPDPKWITRLYNTIQVGVDQTDDEVLSFKVYIGSPRFEDYSQSAVTPYHALIKLVQHHVSFYPFREEWKPLD